MNSKEIVSDAGSGTSSGALNNKDEIRGLAVNSGFSEAGVVALPHAHDARDAERFTTWIDAGRAGTMQYLKRTNQQGQLVRARVSTPFEWARSAIVCLANYNSAQPKSTDPAPQDAAWIARYSWTSRIDPQRGRVPSDYHKVLLKRLKTLESKLHERYGDFESRAYVDTGPVVERSLAVAAGLGWSAKNACLIHPKLGSFVFLSVLITSLEVGDGMRILRSAQEIPFGTDRPEKQGHEALTVPDRCGSCTRCIEACPTNALFTPYQMDAARCISYLTIEHKGAIALELMQGMGRQVFGCDICQDVCPWNRKAPIGADPELAARDELVNPSLDWLSSLDEQSFERTFNGSPVRRAQYAGLVRNIAIAMGNAGAGAAADAELRRRCIERLREWTSSEDDGIQSAARWALNRLENLGGTAENR
jgi:epoxyqueuosine reductase